MFFTGVSATVGVTIAKQFELDGTTSATVLAQAIFADGIRNVAAGASAIELKRGLERGLRAARRR